MKNLIITGFLLLFSLATALVLVQQFLSPIKLAGLQGAFDAGEMPEAQINTWLNGSFQAQTDHYLKYNSAFNGELVRLRNQVEYSVFGNINTILTLGKENYLFDPNYIEAREGKDLITDSTFQRKSNSIIQTIGILQSKNIPLLFLFAPNKANYFSEKLNIESAHSTITNRSKFKTILQDAKVPIIDYDEWFSKIKDSTSFLLMPKYGAHWTTYGAVIAGDSLMTKLDGLVDDTLVCFEINSIEISEKARFNDDDYLASLNLMHKWPSPPMAYPTLAFKSGKKANALIITDSFIWNFYDTGIIQNCFDEHSTIVYYFKTAYDINRNMIGSVESVSDNKLLKDRDVIIILSSDPSLKDAGYGFFEYVIKTSKL